MKFSRNSERGFTLLEVMVVVVIIGILATFATLSIGNRALDDRMELESKRIYQILRLASEEAETKGIEIGFRVTTEGYEFLARDAEGLWSQYTESGPLRSRPRLEPFQVELHIEGRAVAPAAVSTDKNAKIKPQILLLSSGETTAFTLDIRAPNYVPHYRIEADSFGKFSIERLEKES